MSSHIIGHSGAHSGQRFALDQTPLTFGRGDDNTVVLASKEASRQHAEIRREGNSYVLLDHGSSNGTYVDGRRIQTHTLQSGDQFEIGDERFRFEAGSDYLQLEVVALNGAHSGQRFALDQAPLTFGRGDDNTVVLASKEASRQHAEIRREGNSYVLLDHGSSNGTYVDGRRIQTHTLQSGDQFEIGDERFRFGEPARANAAGKAEPSEERGRRTAPEKQEPAPPRPPVSRNQPPVAPAFGIRCPTCGRVIDPRNQHCPWDGASLANGQTVIKPPKFDMPEKE